MIHEQQFAEGTVWCTHTRTRSSRCGALAHMPSVTSHNMYGRQGVHDRRSLVAWWLNHNKASRVPWKSHALLAMQAARVNFLAASHCTHGTACSIFACRCDAARMHCKNFTCVEWMNEIVRVKESDASERHNCHQDERSDFYNMDFRRRCRHWQPHRIYCNDGWIISYIYFLWWFTCMGVMRKRAHSLSNEIRYPPKTEKCATVCLCEAWVCIHWHILNSSLLTDSWTLHCYSAI